MYKGRITSHEDVEEVLETIERSVTITPLTTISQSDTIRLLECLHYLNHVTEVHKGHLKKVRRKMDSE